MAKLYDIRAKIGEYEKDGETKGRYVTIGAVVQTKAGAKMIKLDTIPVSWEGFAYLSEPLKQKESGTSNSDSASGWLQALPGFPAGDPGWRAGGV